MSFVHPALAWGALAGLLPIVVHLVDRRRARPQPFAAIDFVLRSRRSTSRKLRLRKLLLLLSRMSLLAAIPLALARPRFASAAAAVAAARGPAATALVLDASGSMRYRRGRETLFARARAAARERLAELSAEEPVTIVICGPRRAVAAAPSFDHAAARAALDAAAASQEPVDLSACVHDAARALGESPVAGKRIAIFTDLTASDWDLAQPGPEVPSPAGPVRPEVEIADAAEGPLANRALSDLAIAPAPEVGPSAYRFTFTVRNHSEAPVSDVPVALRVGDRVLARGFCTLSAHGSERKTLAATFPGGERAVGAVELAPDALTDDDRIPFDLQVPREIQILLVDGAPSPIRYQDEAYFAQEALEAGASPVRTRTVDPEALAPADLEGRDAVFLLGVRTVSAEAALALTRFVDRGGGLFLAMGDRVDADELDSRLGKLLPMPLRLVKTAAPPPREAAEAPSGEENALTGSTPAHFAQVDGSSPIFSLFGPAVSAGLLDVRIYRYFLVDPTGTTARVLASYDDGAPALIEARRGAGRILLFTSSLAREWTDWPIRASFVPALQQMAKELAGVGEERAQPASVVGRPRALAAGTGKTVVSVVSPSGIETPVERDASGKPEALPTEVGLYRVEVRGADGKVAEAPELDFPVVFDPRESDLSRLDPRELAAHLGVAGNTRLASGTSAGRHTPLWTQLLVAAALAFLLEGLLLKR
ncbi:MAG: BatA domain-containing protein [Myxococcales bacterium]